MSQTRVTFFLLGCLLNSLAGSAAARASASPVRVCGDAQEWAPFSFVERGRQGPAAPPTGYSVELLQRILAARGLQFELTLVPWSRCLAGIENGLYAMALDTSLNPERRRKFLFSRAYYWLTPAYFYVAGQPEPLIRALADLKRYRICGVMGWNYETTFDLAADQIDTSATSLLNVFMKLKARHCELLVEQVEIVRGLRNVGGPDYRQMGLAYRAIPGASKVPFHMIVSRKIANGPALVKLLDEGIAGLLESHGADDLARKYLE